MLTSDRIRKIKEAIREQKDNLTSWFNSATEKEKEQCCCDENCPADTIVCKHNEALHRIETGEFGKCVICNDYVESERLEIDFTTSVCLGHYSEEELRLLEQDLELAAKVQQHLLPQNPPEINGLKIAAHTEPAKIVSGDYFDFFRYAKGENGIAVADVMGKGLPASMLMSNLQASLRILGPEYEYPEKIVERLNILFRYNLKLIKFITLFLLKIDTEKKELTYCNAGHNPAYLYNPTGNKFSRLVTTGPAIGLMPEAKFSSQSVKYNQGDLLLIFTDGLTEARNENDDEFGEERIEKYLLESSNKFPGEIILDLRNQVRNFSRISRDDLTLIAVKFL